MKKLYIIILCIMFGSAFSAYAQDPTPINDWNDLNDIRNDLAGDYILMDDLNQASSGYMDYNSGEGWEPISVFTGTFDGNGHIIFELTGSSGGLFGDISGATLQNIGLVNADISQSDNNAGILVNWANNGSLIENSFSTGTITSSGRSSHGGLVGRTDDASTTIRKSWSSADVTVTREGDDARWSGGLAGYIREGIIEDSYATGSVVSTGGNVGGLGGAVGLSSTIGIVRRSYSTGEVNGDANTGGLIGNASAFEESEFIDNFWDTESSGTDASAEGTGLNTADMKTESTFTEAGWDFSEIWGLDEDINDGYPYLLNAIPVEDLGFVCIDRMVVEPDNYPEEVGNLNRVINQCSAENPETVFALKRDAVYWLDETIDVSEANLVIKAEGARGHPPIVRPTETIGGGSTYLFNSRDSEIVFEELFISAIDEEGVARRPFGFAKNNRITFDKGYIIGTHDWMIGTTDTSNTLFITNSVVANLGRQDHINQGRFIDTRGNDQDTIWIENSTFYNLMHSFLRPDGATTGYLHMDHNTIVNVATYIRADAAAHISITNNLLLNLQTHGMDEGGTDGVIEASSDGFNDPDRTFIINNNNVGYLDEEYQTVLNNADKIKVPAVNSIIQGWIDSGMGANIEYEGNFEEGVTFAEPPTSLATWSEAWLAGDDMPMPYDQWDNVAGTSDPASYHYTLDLIRDFSYSDDHDSYMAAEAGYPVGDLNWFPELKIKWENGEIITHAGGKENIAGEFRLVGNYPNPFNPTTNIVYELSSQVDVTLEIYNVLGQSVEILDLGVQAAGRHEVTFNAENLSSGMYLVRMQMGSEVRTLQMTLIK